MRAGVEGGCIPQTQHKEREVASTEKGLHMLAWTAARSLEPVLAACMSDD